MDALLEGRKARTQQNFTDQRLHAVVMMLCLLRDPFDFQGVSGGKFPGGKKPQKMTDESPGISVLLLEKRILKIDGTAISVLSHQATA